MDISLYGRNDQTRKPIILKDIVICDYNELTTVDLSSQKIPAEFEFGAVYLNENGYALAKVRFDQTSLDWFSSNLESVEEPLTRASIWR